MQQCQSGSERPPALLVILRVYLGVILFITNLGKLTRDDAILWYDREAEDAARFYVSIWLTK